MEELRKCYQNLQDLIKNLESKHETCIDDFYNLDDDIKRDCMGDWTDKDVERWEYLAERAAVIRRAYDIMREELHIGEFLPDIDK